MSEPRGTTLGSAAREFVRHPSPRLLLTGALVAVAARVLVGDWTRADVVVIAALLVAQPFVEWLIHVHVLHWRPREIAGRRVDPVPGRSHRRHHQAPKDPRFIFLYYKVVAGSLVVQALAWGLAALTHWAVATGFTVSLLLTLAYEWTHHLIHTDYVPRHAPYRSLWRAHRLHHFRNENYWYGVTSGFGDRVLGTYPDKDEVPLSPTATTLAHLGG
ncbi:MAG TPA: sterol desaturase family protein [Mycobacteriales bacterium]|nr:sterol desaturase family protein [Mycobacteriales bacterium]